MLKDPNILDEVVSVEEYALKLNKDSRRKLSVMQFPGNANMDLSRWSKIEMERENNEQERAAGEEIPKFGAGSEFKKEEKEEFRRKKLGFKSRKYNPDKQPWIMNCGGKSGKKYRGTREGGITENTSYYVFSFETNSLQAIPVSEWYSYKQIGCFKPLSIEEAESSFDRRTENMNYFNLMIKNRMRKDDETAELDEDGKPTATKKKKRKADDDKFKISEADEWISDSSSSEDDEKSKPKKKKPNKEKEQSKAKKDTEDNESPIEESDDGDDEGKEYEYMTDSSEDISDQEAKATKEMKGVGEEKGLKNVLLSDNEDEEGKDVKEEEKGGDENNAEGKEAKGENEESKSAAGNKTVVQDEGKRAKGTKKVVINPIKKVKSEKGSNDVVANAGESKEVVAASTDDSDSDDKSTPDTAGVASSSDRFTVRPRMDIGGDTGIKEEDVKRYLMRKPMTAKELLSKFKSRSNLPSEELTNVLAQILKKINPVKQTINDKLYWSLKTKSGANTSSQ